VPPRAAIPHQSENSVGCSRLGDGLWSEHCAVLPWMLEDFSALQTAGHDAQLIIGPWTHTSPGLTAAGTIRSGIARPSAAA
jgi:hypothetical protein